MSDLILFWHRNDLRISDNIGLSAARKKSPCVVGLFCLDENILTQDDIAPARVKYMIGCLDRLQQRYQELGSKLLIAKGKPDDIVPELAKDLAAKAVYWNMDVEPYAKKRDRKVEEALKEADITVATFWDRLLHYPGEIVTKSNSTPYKVYTPFWRNWKSQEKPAIAKKITSFEEVDNIDTDNKKIIDLPTAEELGFEWDNPLLLQPGETAAQERLEEFCDRAIEDYDEQRDFPWTDGTSTLSAALKFGAIGIRTVWQATIEALDNCRSEESEKGVITWQKELAWREFYQHCMYFFPELEKGAYRDELKNFPWDNKKSHFEAWCEGKTGYPIVDAAMRQLNEVGWMHNRCRMIVASFLTKDLIVDWRWGEKYFMQKLFDGDLSSNNGGWQWSASSGMDPKPLRIFNPASQTQKYDPEAEYIRQWLPELSSVDTEQLVTGKIPDDERDRCDYPQKIVDHKEQQRKFKELYKQQKE